MASPVSGAGNTVAPGMMTRGAVTTTAGNPSAIARATPRSWLEFIHPEYARKVGRWQYCRDLYEAEVLDVGQVERFLVQRGTGESADAFNERCRLADYTNHFATVVDSLAGMLFQVEANANRVLNDENGNGLGDPNDIATVMGKLWRRADTDGNGYPTVWKLLATGLCVEHVWWVLVDTTEPGRPLLRLLPPSSVTNWRHGPSGLEEALVLEQIDKRRSLVQDPDSSIEPGYVQFTLDGWQRWRVTKEGTPVKVGTIGGYGAYRFTSPDGKRALPIYPVVLPLRRQVGHLMARKGCAIFNKESERDHLARAGSFPKLNLDLADDTAFDNAVDSIRAGANILQGATHNFISPDMSPATTLGEIIKQKVEQYYVTAFREYGDAARGGGERTATEVRQDVGSGVGAFLQLLKAAIDDAENNALWRIAQTAYPDDSKRWFIASVERSEDFLPADPDAVIGKLLSRAYGEGASIPMGFVALKAIAVQQAEYAGVEYDDDQLAAAVQVRIVTDALKENPSIELPAEIRADLAIKVIAAAGLVDAAEEVAGEDGQKVKRLDLLRAKALQAAEAADEAKRREAEFMGMGMGRPDNGGNGGKIEDEE